MPAPDNDHVIRPHSTPTRLPAGSSRRLWRQPLSPAALRASLRWSAYLLPELTEHRIHGEAILTHRTESLRAFVLVGRVQGVGFRWWARSTAATLGLRGTVRNLPDGSVEVRVAGPANRVDQFVHALRSGPSQARVDALREIPLGHLPPAGFRIAH
ncbi:MAG: acylphosphatase [Gemmatimonadetes bacterium]|nr:acylphosphatase [Gemmatimonadota bacterium]